MTVKRKVGQGFSGIYSVLCLLVAAPFSFWLQPVEAEELVDGTMLTVSPGDPALEYKVLNGGTLNVLAGAETLKIMAQNSTVNITGGQVPATISGRLSILSGAGTIDRATLSGRLLSNKSAVKVSNSVITDSSRGLEVSAVSAVELVNTDVVGTGSEGGDAGVFMFGNAPGPQLTTYGGSITGGGKAIWIFDLGSLNLNGTRVTGVLGPAILVDSIAPGESALINVSNGTTLTGGNGNILEVNHGSATMNVNTSALVGNIAVGNASNLNLLLGNRSSLTGDINTVLGSTSNVVLTGQSVLTGGLTNVTSLSINNGSRWNMAGDGNVAALSLDNGVVNFGSTAPDFRTLTLGTLNGNGTFDMKVDLQALSGDRLNVTGAASGIYVLDIANTGEAAVSGAPLTLVSTGEGDARFAVLGGAVDVGAYEYLLEQSGTDWQLVGTQKLTPSAASVLGLSNAAPTAWYGELATLRSRLGDLRMAPKAEGGAWTRTYGTRYKVAGSDGVDYDQRQYGISVGADTSVNVADGRALVGVFGGYSQSDLDFGKGTKGTVDSYYTGVYGTWLTTSGYYLDGVVKANYLRNDADVRMSDGTKAKGNYNNLAYGASLEAGRRIGFNQDWFIEPFVQLASVHFNGKNYSLDNGLQASNDSANSLQARLGASLGRNMALRGGGVVQPFVKAALVQDYSKSNTVKINSNKFDNDLSGTRSEIGVGAIAQLNDTMQMYGNVDYGSGHKIDQPWGFNIGGRYNW